MGITLTRIDKPYVFEFENERGIKCLIDAAPGIGGTDRGFRPMELLGGALANLGRPPPLPGGPERNE